MGGWRRVAIWTVCVLFTAIAAPVRAEGNDPVRILKTVSGVRYGVMGNKGASPKPTLFIFANDIEGTLGVPLYSKVGMIAEEHGYLCVSLDLPFHPGEGLAGWAAATKRGEAWVPEFTKKVSGVLDELIKQGYTDPQKVAVAGTSRGGFMAMQVAAADRRFRCAIGFIPVTDLTKLTEFAGMADNALARSLELENVASQLAGRSVWMAIGNNDDRVNTDSAMAFERKLVAATLAGNQQAPAPVVDVELRVMPWEGHGRNGPYGDKDGLSGAHEAAAEWLLARMGKGRGQRGE